MDGGGGYSVAPHRRFVLSLIRNCRVRRIGQESRYEVFLPETPINLVPDTVTY